MLLARGMRGNTFAVRLGALAQKAVAGDEEILQGAKDEFRARSNWHGDYLQRLENVLDLIHCARSVVESRYSCWTTEVEQL